MTGEQDRGRSGFSRVRRAFSEAGERLAVWWWPLLQQTAAATIAWVLAEHVVDHHQPFFAPIAAVVALNASFGERGTNALRLLEGVLVGIAVGELTIAVLGAGYGSLALALFVAMSVARAVGGTNLTLAQAAAGAILTVAVPNVEGGIDRVVDALIGAAVALVFTQILFSPEPVRLLRRAEAAALTAMADGMRLTARSLADNDDDLASEALDALRTVRDRLSELARVRRASTRVARHSLVWRGRTDPVVQEKENAEQLDLLGDSTVMLTRGAVATSTAGRAVLAPYIAELADTLGDLSQRPGERSTRQEAVDRLVRLTERLTPQTVHEIPREEQPALDTALVLTRVVVSDVLTFAGVDPQQASRLTLKGLDWFGADRPPRRALSTLGRLMRKPQGD
ncbi:FUSC family protein [Luteipulveratus sp. YIM 133132]|uniref:FUSC family protein n=1 Tax=Luteipulveratus flavus TaxID=3031728 RepID=UPI0023AF2E50|nr:FUSC family protein [Luteipulveratus sp. YIM 133132]MDE9367158.1 FUSC family protein [Luteipulveratus sp. YIM 133132]